MNIVCNNSGVWAVDDRGHVHFRHGHISASQHSQANEKSLLPPAWIQVPGDAKRFRSFVQVFCGPEDWMVKDLGFGIKIFIFVVLFFQRSMQQIRNKMFTHELV